MMSFKFVLVVSLSGRDFFPLRAHAYSRTYGRTRATLTPTPPLTPALGRVAPTDGHDPRARGTYIVVTYVYP